MNGLVKIFVSIIIVGCVFLNVHLVARHTAGCCVTKKVSEDDAIVLARVENNYVHIEVYDLYELSGGQIIMTSNFCEAHRVCSLLISDQGSDITDLRCDYTQRSMPYFYWSVEDGAEKYRYMLDLARILYVSESQLYTTMKLGVSIRVYEKPFMNFVVRLEFLKYFLRTYSGYSCDGTEEIFFEDIDFGCNNGLCQRCCGNTCNGLSVSCEHDDLCLLFDQPCKALCALYVPKRAGDGEIGIYAGYIISTRVAQKLGLLTMVEEQEKQVDEFFDIYESSEDSAELPQENKEPKSSWFAAGYSAVKGLFFGKV